MSDRDLDGLVDMLKLLSRYIDICADELGQRLKKLRERESGKS